MIDSHCHLDFPDLAADLPGVIARARRAGVDRMLTIATHVGRAATYRAIAESHPEVFFSVGTHPHHAAEEPDVPVQAIVAEAAHPRCIAIGEAGLDFHYDRSPREIQERVFRSHITAARSAGLPLVIHAREADDDMIRILTEEHGRGAFEAVLHCFSSTARLAEVGVALGFYVSFSGILTFRTSDEIRRIAREVVPQDRLLVETDAPYLAPAPLRGQRNEPSYVVHTARVLAEVLSIKESVLAALTTANFQRLFRKALHAADVDRQSRA